MSESNPLWDDPEVTWDDPVALWGSPFAVPYFLPPTQLLGHSKDHYWDTQDALGHSIHTGADQSRRYTGFLKTLRGQDVVIGGVTYPGGRWTGPLTDAQVTAITSAGYGSRIVSVPDSGFLPAGLD